VRAVTTCARSQLGLYRHLPALGFSVHVKLLCRSVSCRLENAKNIKHKTFIKHSTSVPVRALSVSLRRCVRTPSLICQSSTSRHTAVYRLSLFGRRAFSIWLVCRSRTRCVTFCITLTLAETALYVYLRCKYFQHTETSIALDVLRLCAILIYILLNYLITYLLTYT